jgi:hypothetical protein
LQGAAFAVELDATNSAATKVHALKIEKNFLAINFSPFRK